jgi:hypothetical protein
MCQQTANVSHLDGYYRRVTADAVVTIIMGLDKTVAQTFSSQGSTVFTVPKNPQIIKSREEFVSSIVAKTLHEDGEAIRRLCTACWRVGLAANLRQSSMLIKS